jgi:hypothetical protein
MGDWRERIRRGMNVRTYVFVAVLVATIVWIQSLDGQLRAARARAAAKTTISAASAPATDNEARAADEGKDSAEGWGRDPFDPRFGGTRN